MKPHRLLAETRLQSGAVLTLHEHDSSYCVRLAGRELMHSDAASSELMLGELGVARLARVGAAKVLIGGLGLGFTLRSVLAHAGAEAGVDVVELLPEMVAWNREHLGPLNGARLDDRRVRVRVDDVFEVIRAASPGSYGAILLDIDNGPTAMVQTSNTRLYDARGLKMLVDALVPGGRLVVWSAGPDRAFERRLAQAGFRVETVPVKLHPGARQAAGRLFVADKSTGRRAGGGLAPSGGRGPGKFRGKPRA